jgi:hypothetical protein
MPVTKSPSRKKKVEEISTPKKTRISHSRLIKKNRDFAKKHDLPTLAETFELNKDLWHLSKFKPLSERFDPKWFKPAALDAKKNGGKYTKAPYKSKAYREYWDAQYKRCVEGYDTHGFHCPGDLYYFLNFYVLPIIETNAKSGRKSRALNHPDFWDVHYYFAHYIQWARTLEQDAVCLKPRGVGWSEYNASMGCNQYTAFKGSTVMFTASSIGYLTSDGIMSKVNRQLNWQNENTQRGFKKLRQKKNTPLNSRASKLDREGNEKGWLSEILGKVIDSPDKLRGTRTDLLVLEEAGSFKHSKKAVSTAKALTEIGGVKFGTLVAFGTGGDESSKGEALEGLKEMLLHPDIYNMLGIKNRYNGGKSIITSGFFFSSYECMQKYMNSQGITDLEQAYNSKMAIRKKIEDAGAVKLLIDEKAEYPFIPEEAFMKGGSNLFDRIKLANQKLRLSYELLEGKSAPERGELEWERKSGTNVITGVRWVPKADGRIVITEPPMRDSKGEVYKNLYIGGIDSIDTGSANSLVGSAGSKFGLLIKKRYLNAKTTGNKYVARYMERPEDERTAYEISLKIAMYYNAKYNVERTKKEVISWYRQHKVLKKYIVNQPSLIGNDVSSKRTADIPGTPINPKVIAHYIGLIKQYTIDYADTIEDMDLLDQMLNYSDEMKTIYDLIAAMGMCELLDEELDAVGSVPSIPRKASAGLELWGYYIDKNGYKKNGPIPTYARTAVEEYTRLGLETPVELYQRDHDPEDPEEDGVNFVDAEDFPEDYVAQENKLIFDI